LASDRKRCRVEASPKLQLSNPQISVVMAAESGADIQQVKGKGKGKATPPPPPPLSAKGKGKGPAPALQQAIPSEVQQKELKKVQIDVRSVPQLMPSRSMVMKEIQQGKELKTVETEDRSAPQLMSSRSMVMKEIQQGKELKIVETEDRSAPQLLPSRSMVMKEIQQGKELKKVETKDNSAPQVKPSRSQMLAEILRGKALKKVEINDRSAPQIADIADIDFTLDGVATMPSITSKRSSAEPQPTPDEGLVKIAVSAVKPLVVVFEKGGKLTEVQFDTSDLGFEYGPQKKSGLMSFCCTSAPNGKFAVTKVTRPELKSIKTGMLIKKVGDQEVTKDLELSEFKEMMASAMKSIA